VGSGLGALLGGVLMQQLGGQALFFICSLVVLAGWLVGYVVELLLVRRDQHVKA
jgi:predicted MFS family arabinose efflux permease